MSTVDVLTIAAIPPCSEENLLRLTAIKLEIVFGRLCPNMSYFLESRTQVGSRYATKYVSSAASGEEVEIYCLDDV